jgi:hypothetical protein
MIVQAIDVVFAEIAAYLNPGRLARQAPLVFEPMRDSNRQIGRLFLRKQERLVSTFEVAGVPDEFRGFFAARSESGVRSPSRAI